MHVIAVSLVGSILLIAAPGEPPVAEGDVPDVAKAAVIRRLEPGVAVIFRGIVVRPSRAMPGYVVCGEVSGREGAQAGSYERFFVVVPGSFALLDRDGNALIDQYWKRNGC